MQLLTEKNVVIAFNVIGGFTVTSYAGSRGRLAPLDGKRFVAGGCACAGIHALFAFNSFTHKIMIMFCIGAGYIGHCVDGSFYFVIIQKKEKRGKLWFSLNNGDAKVKKIINRACRHFISLSFYYNTYQSMLHHRKYNNRL